MLAPLLDAGLTKAEIQKIVGTRRTAYLGPARHPPVFFAAALRNRSHAGTIGAGGARRSGFAGIGLSAISRAAPRQVGRVEISQEEMLLAFAPEMAAKIAERLKAAGFSYVAVDLEGYRQGSLNEAISKASDSGPWLRAGT